MAEEQEKQAEMEFSYRYSVEEMGTLVQGTKTISLFSSFIKDKLSGSLIDTEPIFREGRRIIKVECPFCKKGFLKLKEVRPHYGGGLGGSPRKMHHTGNEYEYVCSNPDCAGRFIGRYIWM